MTTKNEDRTFVESCGNVFRDLGLEDSTEEYVRSLMAIAVVKILKKKGLLESQEQAQAAAALGVHQPQISKLVGAHTCDFSLDQLIRYIHQLGGVLNVTIDVHDKPQEPPMHLTIAD